MSSRSFVLRCRDAALVGILTIGLTGCANNSANDSVTQGATTTVLPAGEDTRIDRVVDGDTVVTSGGVRVRMIGIDTPETVKPDSPVECYGPQSSALTKQLLPSGTSVRLSFDRERFDRFDRTLAYVYRSQDGLFVNSTLIKQGAARTLSIEPNTLNANVFSRLESQAKRDERGLWGQC